MNWLKTIFREIFGLFVDDGSFAIAILFWLALVKFLTPHLGLYARWSGVILFLGLAAILVESAARFAKRPKPGK
jgi:hypothetical protein